MMMMREVMLFMVFMLAWMFSCYIKEKEDYGVGLKQF